MNINIHIFQAGIYKEFVEPYSRTDMSEEARLANQTLVDELWGSYREQVIENLVAAGMSAFEVASPDEMRAVRALCPDAVLHYNNPVRSVAEIAEAVRRTFPAGAMHPSSTRPMRSTSPCSTS